MSNAREQVKEQLKHEFSKETLKKEGKGLLMKIFINVAILSCGFWFLYN